MRVHHLAAFVALGFWQVAPVRVVTTPAGRFRLAVAGATGQWEDYERIVSCDGMVTERSSVARVLSAGARADAYLGEGRIRLTAVAGRRTADSAWAGSGAFWGAQAAVEERVFGLGVGYASAGGPLIGDGWDASLTGLDHVSVHLRAGPLDRVYAVAELHPLSETPSLAGDLRIGVGFGDPRARRATGLAGIVLGPLGPSEGHGTAAFFDLSIPTGPSIDVLFRGVRGSGHKAPHWGAGVGLRAAW